jgi:hypothetical protein
MFTLTNDGFGKPILNSLVFKHAPDAETADSNILLGSATTYLTNANGDMLKVAALGDTVDVTVEGVAYAVTVTASEAVRGITLAQVLADVSKLVNKPSLGGLMFSPYDPAQAADVVRDRVKDLVRNVINLTGPILSAAPSNVNQTLNFIDTAAAPAKTTLAAGAITATTVVINLLTTFVGVGRIYYRVLADGAGAPTADAVKANGLYFPISDVASTGLITGLVTGTAYDIYFVTEGNGILSTATKLDVTTV